jgi:5-methylcytosine-specific restriction endonuclease McrA
MKTCTKCGETKPLEDFHRHAPSPDGRKPRCKGCRVVESVANYARNGERIRAAARQWQRDNSVAAAARARRYRSSDKGRATREASNLRSDKKARDRAYYAANADAAKARARARQAKVRGVAAERFKHYEVFDRDGWVCQLCAEPVDPEVRYPDPMSVSLDHVIPLALGGAHSKANTQTAHLICNRRKGTKVA